MQCIVCGNPCEHTGDFMDCPRCCRRYLANPPPDRDSEESRGGRGIVINFRISPTVDADEYLVPTNHLDALWAA